MKRYVLVMQNNLKKSSGSFFTFMLKIFSGSVLGLAFAIISQRIFEYGNLGFVFVIMMTLSVFLLISKGWNAWVVGIFNLFCVLAGLLLRMYALVAPGT